MNNICQGASEKKKILHEIQHRIIDLYHVSQPSMAIFCSSKGCPAQMKFQIVTMVKLGGNK